MVLVEEKLASFGFVFLMVVVSILSPVYADRTSNIRFDPDNDGLTNPEEERISEQVEGADPSPLKKDIIIEIDYYEGEKPSNRTISIIEDRFESAPIENPDGTTGIDAHIIVDESFSGDGSVEFDEYRNNHYENLYDYEGYGAYHVLIVEEAVPSRLGVVGMSGGEIDGVIVDDSSGSERLAAIIIHELGHQLGLSGRDYDGIDSRNISYEEYPSIMNYNGYSPFHGSNFSSGKGFDDWEHIRKSLPSTAPSTFNLHPGTIPMDELLKIVRRKRFD